MTQELPIIKENAQWKTLRSRGYNFNFSKQTGYFQRWGEATPDDPQFSPFGPEIADIEISSGFCSGNCPHCYKTNNSKCEAKYMSLATFQEVFKRLPKILTQIAFGITDIKANPDFFPIMEYADQRGVKCNYTCHGLDVDEEIARKTAALCGAVAVSIVQRDKSYDAVKLFTDAGMKQVNIHCVFYKEKIDKIHALIDDIAGGDSRLAKLNALVFLSYKPKGLNTDLFTVPSQEDFASVMEHCERAGVNYGFDSCSANMFIKTVENRPEAEELKQCAEQCCACCFSSYINIDARYFPCSFVEGQAEEGWSEGINVLDYDNFEQVWNHPRAVEYREHNLKQKANMKNPCKFGV